MSDEKNTEKESLEQSFQLMKAIFVELNSKNVVQDRHISIVRTKIEEAMMWLNKNRAKKGYFEKKLSTHVE